MTPIPLPSKPKRKKAPLKELPPPEWFTEATRKIADIGDGWNRIVLPSPPSVNRAYKLGTIAGHATMFLSPEAKQFKKWVETICVIVGIRPIIGNVYVMIDLYRERKAGDVDPTKLLLDSLQGFAYANDSQIVEMHVRRREDPAFPRVEFAVKLATGETMEMEGLFR